MDNQNMIFVVIGLCAVILGLVLLAAGVVFLIVRALKRKPKKGPVIFLAVGILLAIAGIATYSKSSSAIMKEYQGDLNLQKVQAAMRDADGSVCFRLSDFSYSDDSGNVFDSSTLSEYRYTVINRWEPWCGPCKAELPDLEKLYGDYRGRGINFVGIYTTEEDAAKVIASNGITYPTVLIDSDVPNAFSLIDTSVVPVTCIVDSEGRLVRLGLTEEEIKAGGGDVSSEELAAFYDCVAAGARSYDYWAEKLDSLPD